MSNIITNKGNIQPIPVELYRISAGELTTFLREQVFGHNLETVFERFIGSAGGASYVKMTCLFRKADIAGNEVGSNDVLAQVMAKEGLNVKFSETFMRGYEKYKFEDYIHELFTNPNYQHEAAEATRAGICGRNYENLVRGASLKLDKERGLYIVNLRADQVLIDMLSNPNTNKVNGDFKINSISGVNSETIVWNISVSRYDGSLQSDILNPLFGQRIG